MQSLNQAERILKALGEMHQFQPARNPSRPTLIHVVTGAVVALASSEEQEQGFLEVRLPGGDAFLVNGYGYLDVQLIEHVRLVEDSPDHGRGPVSEECQRLKEHFYQRHGIE